MPVMAAPRRRMLETLIKDLGFELRGDELYKDGAQVKCTVCGRPITRENLLAIIPGSLRFVCNSKTCSPLVPKLCCEVAEGGST